MWGYPEFMVWWWIIGIVCIVVFWVTIVGLVVWGIKQFFSNRGEGSPIEIAQKRLARGDISKEQFDELREALR